MSMAMELIEKHFAMDACTGISSLLILKSSSKQFVNLLFSSNQSIFSLQIPRNQLKDNTANTETKTHSLDSIQTVYSLRTAAERVGGEFLETVHSMNQNVQFEERQRFEKQSFEHQNDEQTKKCS